MTNYFKEMGIEGTVELIEGSAYTKEYGMLLWSAYLDDTKSNLQFPNEIRQGYVRVGSDEFKVSYVLQGDEAWILFEGINYTNKEVEIKFEASAMVEMITMEMELREYNRTVGKVELAEVYDRLFRGIA